MLFANTLHYLHDPADVLGRFVGWLRPHGRVVIVEYDGRQANRWVPYPVSLSQLPDLVRRAGLSSTRDHRFASVRLRWNDLRS